MLDDAAAAQTAVECPSLYFAAVCMMVMFVVPFDLHKMARRSTYAHLLLLVLPPPTPPHRSLLVSHPGRFANSYPGHPDRKSNSCDAFTASASFYMNAPFTACSCCPDLSTILAYLSCQASQRPVHLEEVPQKSRASKHLHHPLPANRMTMES